MAPTDANPPSMASAQAGPGLFAGVALVALATMMYQLLLTRIFSVSMWYHFAFMAISLTMFGMTAGAIAVYRFPGFFRLERTTAHLALSAIAFGVSILLSFLTHLSVPFVPGATVVQLYGLAFNYVVLAVPFVCSGVCISLAMTRFPDRVGRLYGADLAGAALACPLTVLLLNRIDAPSAVTVTALLAALGGAAFASRSPGRLRRLSIEATLALALLAGIAALAAAHGNPPLRLTWVKGKLELEPLYERWNAFSRITVRTESDTPFGWGLSDRLPADRRIEQRLISIDAIADTVLTRFDGDLGKVDHLRYDVTNLAHHLRHDARVLTIGVGGGRDLLSALAFGQKSVTGVEINPQIVEAVTGPFGDFTGHLDRQPGVTLVNDEARSFIARSRDTFDIIQLSLIDTFAATAAGAYVLTENALYTREAWTRMLARLSPDGILSVSRWYFRDRPGEVYRLTALAAATLRDAGIDDPRAHLIIARKMGFFGPDRPDGVGTLLLSRSPFSAGDVEQTNRIAADLGFDVVLSPPIALSRGSQAGAVDILVSPPIALDDTFARLASGRDLEAFTRAYPLDISPPTDDRPFFFHMLRLGDLRLDLLDQGVVSFNMRAVVVLGALLFLVCGLTLVCIVLPLWLGPAGATEHPGESAPPLPPASDAPAVRATRRPAPSLRGAWPLLLYFLAIGFGFMLIEIAIMQRLNLFLGHPVYGMTVVLFSLLLAGGAGSWLSQRWVIDVASRRAAGCLAAAVAAIAVVGLLEPRVFARFESAATPVRIGAAVALLVPIGMVMGTAFPLGMRLASTRSAALAPWLWGLNGAASVCASVVAVAVSLSLGISAAYVAGLGCYVLAMAAWIFAGTGRAVATIDALESALDPPADATASLRQRATFDP